MRKAPSLKGACHGMKNFINHMRQKGKGGHDYMSAAKDKILTKLTDTEHTHMAIIVPIKQNFS